jgi:hypothetical protein
MEDRSLPETWDKRMERLKEKGMTSFSMPLKVMAMKGMLPTPAARDYKGGKSKQALEKRRERGNLIETLPDKFPLDLKTSQLNPRFVAEMMGFPENWTELPFLNGETSQSKPTATQ